MNCDRMKKNVASRVALHEVIQTSFRSTTNYYHKMYSDHLLENVGSIDGNLTAVSGKKDQFNSYL
jgi:hypothetical protein